jgi:hypothetical protein
MGLGTTTIQQVLNKVALDLMESNSTFPSGLWTRSEVIGYINYAVENFINNTGVIVSDNTIHSEVGVSVYTRPSDTGDVDRISFEGKRCRRVSNFDLMTMNPNWRSSTGTPRYYHEDGVDIDEFELDKKPTRIADIRVFGDYLHTNLDSSDISDLSVVIGIPDAWVPAIQWEVLSFCYSKDGESQDLPRSIWAHNKYLYFVSLCQRMITGESDSAIPQIQE